MNEPIAVELLALRTLARADSSSPAEGVLNKQQLAALRHMSHRPLPKKPTVQDALWCIAGLGGHIKNNGPPGWQILGRGFLELITLARGAAHLLDECECAFLRFLQARAGFGIC